MELYANAENLERVIIENEMVLVFFGNNSCGVCRDIKPKVKALLQKYPRIQGRRRQFNQTVCPPTTFFAASNISFTEGKKLSGRLGISVCGNLEQKLDRYYYLAFEP